MNFLRTHKLALFVPTCWPQGNHNRTRLPGGAAQARHLCGGCPDRLPMLARARERATKFSGPTTKATRTLKHVIGPPSNMHLRCSRPPRACCWNQLSYIPSSSTTKSRSYLPPLPHLLPPSSSSSSTQENEI
jgi:hypothetical protein